MGENFFLKEDKKILICLFVIILFISFTCAETIVGLDIPNAPPRLITDIPNQSWIANHSNLNAFDLDDYFEDPEGNTLTYYNSTPDSIFVSINNITHVVSFFPNQGFTGTKKVTFYASDSIYDTLSNVVTLSVGEDDLPPQWNSPSTDKDTVYQNDIVTFTTVWTDDRDLNNFIFSINQGAGWENYTSVSFTGTQNTSNYSVQIRAPSYSTVYWRYYAFDSSGNSNSTDIQSFSVSEQSLPPSGGGGSGSGSGEGSGEGDTTGSLFQKLDVLKIRKVENFMLSVSGFKITLKQGSFKTSILKITNTGLDPISVHLSSEKVSDFVTFSETNISIMPGMSKEVTIDFNAPERAIPGQYFGYIIVKSPKIKKSLPVVLDIQGINLDFDLKVNLSEGYELVRPGNNVKANITITQLKDLKQIKANLHYSIKDYDGIVYNFSEEEIELFSSLELERELQVPDISPEGNYVFYARVSDEKNIAIDSVSFEVGTRFNFSSFFKMGTLIIFIILFALFLATFMIKYRRDKKKERLIELYIMLNNLKNLIKQNKQDDALKLFIKIKDLYHEPVAKEVFNDKERLKKEISELYTNLTKDSKGITINNNAAQINKSLPKEEIKENNKTLKEEVSKDKIKDDKK